MVGPSITAEDREKFLVRLKVGFGLFWGLSMGLVTVYSGAPLATTAGVTVGISALGIVVGWILIPDSIAESPYDDPDRGPKPGVRTQRRRERQNDTRADGDGRPRRER